MRFSLCFSLVCGLGCAGSTADPGADVGTHHGHDGGHSVGDAGHPQGDTGLPGDVYAAGMTKTTTNGLYRVALVESAPIPRDLTLYTWTVEVRDVQDNPVAASRVTAEPTMPDHGHGTHPRFTEGAPNGQTGQFVLTDMDLFMAGTWQVELRVTVGDQEDTAFFYFILDS